MAEYFLFEIDSKISNFDFLTFNRAEIRIDITILVITQNTLLSI